MGRTYKVNIVDNRERSSRIIAKRIKLRKQLNENIPLTEKIVIEKKIKKLTSWLDSFERKNLKLQQEYNDTI